MSSNEPTHSISVNTGIIDKPAERGRHKLGKSWQSMEVTCDGLTHEILCGHAIASQYEGGHRKTANFVRSGFLAADVDYDLTLDQAREHAFVQRHAALIHTTASHTADRHRFRIIFLLDEPILSVNDWSDAQFGLALEIESDRAVTNGGSSFFGCSRATIFRIGRTMPPDVVARLIARGRDARASQSFPGGQPQPVNSVRKISGPELVKIAGGELVRMDEIEVHVRVHCPYHEDRDPSAVTVASRAGAIGIYCSACAVTFWSNDARDDYDFAGFDRLCEEKSIVRRADEPEPTGLDRFFPPEPKFIRSQTRFLEPFGYEPGITMVKSAKGSGKTEALKALVRQVRRGEFRADLPKKEIPKSVLLIGHRVSLLREAAAKLGIRCYLDPGDDPDPSMRTLAVCLDSLPKHIQPGKPFDVAIIDESEQVLSHLFGKTIEARLGVEQCFDALMYEVANAKSVYLLDADLGLTTAQAVRTMRPQDWRSRCRIIYNEPIVPKHRRTMRLYQNKSFVEKLMIEAIKRGERCFVVSNSKAFIKTAERMIRNECGENIVMRVITSDNSREEATIRFLKNIKTEILNVQVTAGTPSIGTGIDITFPDGARHVDRVFGFFEPLINTHTDIDQQLARVRNPGRIDVWIQSATFDFTCNIDVVKDDLARAYTVPRAVKGRRPDGMVDYDRDDPLLMICAHVTALQRASKNRPVELFRALREANGWTVQWVEAMASTQPHETAVLMLQDERKQMLLDAPVLGDDDFIELDEKVTKGAALTKVERATHEKNHFERSVGLLLDSELIGLNLDGRLLDRIAMLADIMSIWEQGHQSDFVGNLLEPTTLPKGRLEDVKPQQMMAVLLRAANLTDRDGFRTGVMTNTDSLVDFAAICRENRTTIEEVLAGQIRGDFDTNPVRQLNNFLRTVGLQFEDEPRVKKVAGKKIRYYSINSRLLETMLRIAKSYLATRALNEEAKELARGARDGRRPKKAAEDEPTPAKKPDLLSFVDPSSGD